MRDLLRRYFSNDGGAVAVIVGLGLPALAGLSAAAVQYSGMLSRNTQLQKAADAAAVGAARELGLAGATDERISSVAKSIVLSVLGPESGPVQIQAEVQKNRTWVRVALDEPVTALLGKLLPLPSSLQVEATGQLVSGKSKLCMLALDPSASQIIHLHSSAAITAHGCTIQSNSSDQRGINIEDNAHVTADVICSTGGYKQGRNVAFSRDPIANCPAIKDPLASRTPPSISVCLSTGLQIDGRSTPRVTLTPGVYCGGLKITEKAQVTLLSGVYVFDNGPLVVEKGGSLTGNHAGFYFTGDKGGLLFDVDSTISLSAPKDGPMAGLLFFEHRSVSAPVAIVSDLKPALPLPPPGSAPMRTYRIISNNARNVLGTIYLPAGRLVIDASKPVADLSAYTVIVARQVELFDGPNLYLNTNYSGSDVPVPAGVGPQNNNTVSLVR